MFLIGDSRQLVRTHDGIVHFVRWHSTIGFANRAACGIDWRRTAEFEAEDATVSCMTCLVHEARS